MNTNTTTIELFNGNPVAFHSSDAFANATTMAAPFGRKPHDFLRLPSTKEFIDALAEDLGALRENLVTVVQGGDLAANQQGTWLHPDLAIEFARWLSPRFSIWCNRTIRRILAGEVSPQPIPEVPRCNVFDFCDGRLSGPQILAFAQFVKRHANAFALAYTTEPHPYFGELRSYPIGFLHFCRNEWHRPTSRLPGRKERSA